MRICYYKVMNRVGIQRLRLFQSTSGKRVISTDSLAHKYPSQKTLEDIPGPRSLPAVGSLFDLLFYKRGLCKGIIHLPQERVKEFGKIYRERFTSKEETVFLADPKDIELVFRDENSYMYPRRFVRNRLFDYFYHKYNREPGLFFVTGVDWYRYRSPLSKRMLVPRSVRRHTPVINKISSDFLTRLKTLRAPEYSQTSYEVERIDHELFKWSFELVSFSMFEKRFGSIGDKVDPKVQKFIQAISMFLGSVVPTAYLPPKFYDYYHTKSYKTFASSYDKMYQLGQYFIIQYLQELQQREGFDMPQNDKEVSLLQYLLLKEELSEKDLLTCVIDLLFAGVDTTSSTMQWILYELAKNPDKQAALLNEIMSTLPGKSHDHLVSSDDLQNLPYLKAVVKETLRLHPVLNQLQRYLQKDLVLSGYKVPAGTRVLICSYVMGHDEDLFQKPEQFLPERWLRSKSTNNRDFNHYSSLPFGFGRRMCIGKRLAELGMHVLLIHILSAFHLEYPENETVEPIARGTLVPEKPVRVKFIERK